jgi:hypothetical protein
MLGLGSVTGFFMSVAVPAVKLATHSGFQWNLNLPRMFPFPGTRRPEVLSVLASFFLIAAVHHLHFREGEDAGIHHVCMFHVLHWPIF